MLKRQSTKADSAYNPEPYTVTDVMGTQIRAARGSEVKTRDAQLWKKLRLVVIERPYPRRDTVQPSTYLTDPDIGMPERQQKPLKAH